LDIQPSRPISAVVVLGAVAIGQRNPELARYHFREALDRACNNKDLVLITDALAGVAELLSQTSKLPEAVQLCTFVFKHRASERPARREGELLAQLEEMLTAEVYQSAVNIGHAMTIEEAVTVAREQTSSA
jgi:hypothetical protein